ncbi:MAG: hypothetical protein ACKPE1_28715 [Dolichospermum sp.]
MNHETLVVRASCPLNMYLITPGSAVRIINHAHEKIIKFIKLRLL